MRQLTAALVLAGAVLVGGCGSDDKDSDGPSREDVSAELAKVFAQRSTDVEDYAECFGDKLAATRSADKLVSDGLLTSDYKAAPARPVLEQPAAIAYVDAWLSCIDYVEVSGVAQKKVSPSTDLEGYTGCLRAAVDPALFRQYAIDLMTGKTDSQSIQDFSKVQQKCAREHTK